MKKKKLLAAFLVLAVSVVLVALLGACSSSGSEGDKSGREDLSEETAYPVGSLKATHVNGELDNADDYSNKLCLACHNRDSFEAATENYGGTEGYNPHRSHNAAGDCVTCHSVEGTSILSCNECHNENPPEGWQSAQRGSGPVHDLSK